MNVLNKLSKYFPILPGLINIIILINIVIWLAHPPSPLLASLIIFILLFLIVLNFIDFKKNYLLFIFFSYALFLTLGLGTTEWDARTIWLAHAKVIYIDQDLYSQIAEGRYIGGHVEYPIGFPALAATLANLVGIWNEVYPKAALIFFLMPPLFITFQILQSKSLEIIFLVGLAIICRSYLFNGYMDALVALYTWAIILLFLARRCSVIDLKSNILFTRNNYFVITLISFLGVVLMLKNEGLAITIILIIFLLFYRLSLSYTQLLMVTLIPFIFYFYIWKLPLLHSGITNDLMSEGIFKRIFDRLSNFNDIKLIISYFFQYLDLFSCAFILNFFRKNVYVKHFILPISFVISYTLLLFIIYLSTPNDLNWHLFTSVKRALLPILLVMFGCIVFSLSSTYTEFNNKK